MTDDTNKEAEELERERKREELCEKSYMKWKESQEIHIEKLKSRIKFGKKEIAADENQLAVAEECYAFFTKEHDDEKAKKSESA